MESREKLLTNLLKELSQYNCAIIRGHENVFDSEDIDILISKKQLELLKKRLLRNFFMTIDTNESNPHVQFIKYFKDGKRIKLDFLAVIAFLNNGRGLISSINVDALLRRSSKNDVLNSLAAEDEYILGILHSLLDKKKFSNKHQNRLENLSREIGNERISEMSKDYGVNEAFNKVLCHMNFANPPNLKWTFFWSHILKNSNFIRWSKRGINKFKRNIFRREQRSILVFMGPDGSGKTTMIDEFRKKHSDYAYAHLGNKSNLLPSTRLINSFRKRRLSKRGTLNNNERIFIETIKAGFFSKIKNALFEINFYLEVFFAINWLIIKQRFSKNEVKIVIDRYIYDRFIGRKNLTYFGFFPKPSLIIYMKTPLEILLERKQEHSYETLQGFIARYEEFLDIQSFSPSVYLSGTSTLNEGLDMISNYLERK